MAAFTTAVTGLTTTGSNVERGRVYDVDPANAPALSIYQGADEPVEGDSQAWPVRDSLLTVYVDIHVKQTSTAETTLNQVRKELAIALMADLSLGLSFVHQIIEGAADDPERSGEAEKPTQTQRTTWQVHYRRSVTDPSSGG